jgi:hypothetical protein
MSWTSLYKARSCYVVNRNASWDLLAAFPAPPIIDNSIW